ncbi:MAG: M3 family metallopeptidase [Chitinophagales bacterium]
MKQMIKFKDIPYTQPNFEVLKNEFEALIQAFEVEKEARELYAIFQQINQIQTDFRTAYHLAYVLNAADFSIESHQQKVKYFDTHFPQFHELICQFYRVLLQHPQRPAIESKIGKQYFAIAAKDISTSSPKLIPLKQEENKILGEYHKKLSKQTMLYEGKEVPVWKMSKQFASPDRSIRKKVTMAFWDKYLQDAPQLEATFEELVQIRHRKAIETGYKNFTEVAHAKRLGFGKEEIQNFSRLIQKYFIPLQEKLHLQKIKRLNIDTLQLWDNSLQFADGNPKIEGNFSQILTKFQNLFSSISSELGGLFEEMLQSGYIDAEQRANKYTGYQKITLPKHHVSYIFTQITGEVGDIDFLVHEIGHAFQVHKSKEVIEKAFEYTYGAIELLEIHSTTLEFLALPHYSTFFNKADQTKAHTLFFNTIIHSFLAASAYNEFQQKIYENPNGGINTRNKYWEEIREKYFPSFNPSPNVSHPYFQSGKGWQKIRHIFMMPFYMIDYSLARVCAIQFWMRSEQEGFEVAWRDYVRLCEKGGSISFLEALDLMGFDSPFEEETIRKIAAFLEESLDKYCVD